MFSVTNCTNNNSFMGIKQLWIFEWLSMFQCKRKPCSSHVITKTCTVPGWSLIIDFQNIERNGSSAWLVSQMGCDKVSWQVTRMKGHTTHWIMKKSPKIPSQMKSPVQQWMVLSHPFWMRSSLTIGDDESCKTMRNNITVWLSLEWHVGQVDTVGT